MKGDTRSVLWQGGCERDVSVRCGPPVRLQIGGPEGFLWLGLFPHSVPRIVYEELVDLPRGGSNVPFELFGQHIDGRQQVAERSKPPSPCGVMHIASSSGDALCLRVGRVSPLLGAPFVRALNPLFSLLVLLTCLVP